MDMATTYTKTVSLLGAEVFALRDTIVVLHTLASKLDDQPESYITASEAEALEAAAAEADKAGDRIHAANLRKRAQFVRRAVREKNAGVRGWPMMERI